MKTIWILNHYAQEPGGPGGTRHYSIAKHLQQHGWQAVVIAASSELNTDRQRLEPGVSRALKLCDAVPFLWLRTPPSRGSGPRRLLNIFAYTARAIWPASTRQLPKPDVVMGSSVHPFAAWAGAVLARRHGVPFVFEVRDLWPQTLIDVGRIRANSATARMMRNLERWLYGRAAFIIVLLPHAADYIVPLGIAPEKLLWIPNGVELSTWPPPPQPTDGPFFTLMYFGAHGQVNGLENLLQAMKLIEKRRLGRPVRLRLIGDGPRKPGLRAEAARLGLAGISFEDPVPKNRLPAVAAEADAFLFNLPDLPVFRYGISSNKLFDFMAGARPILFCCRAANNPVEEAGAGITVEPEQPEALAAAVGKLMALPPIERQRMGAAARRFVENYHSFDRLTASFASRLEETCRQATPRAAS